MNTIPSFSFQLEALDQLGNFRIDVYAQDLPAKFLGAGFDMTLSGKDWKYEKYELGPLFPEPQNVLSLAVKKDTPERLIFGLTLKNGSNMKFFQGKLASFFIKLPQADIESKANGTPFEIHFGQGVLSTYDHGRKDVPQVEWVDGSFNIFRVMQSAIQTRVSTEKSIDGLPENLQDDTFINDGEVVENNAVDTNIGLPSTHFVDLSPKLDNGSIFFWFLMGFSLVLVFFILVKRFFLKKRAFNSPFIRKKV